MMRWSGLAAVAKIALVLTARGETAPQDVARRLKVGQGDVDRRASHSEGGGQLFRRKRADGLHTTPDENELGLVLGRSVPVSRDRRRLGVEPHVRERRAYQQRSFAGHPGRVSVLAMGYGGAAVFDQLAEPGRPHVGLDRARAAPNVLLRHDP